MKFEKIDWNKVFFKTFYERRTFFHLLVDFNRIWILHVGPYWFYTAFNSPKVYTPAGKVHQLLVLRLTLLVTPKLARWFWNPVLWSCPMVVSAALTNSTR